MSDDKKARSYKIRTIICVAICLLSNGTVIGFKLKTEHDHKVQFAQASENAERYISEKYGFDAEILGMTNDRYRWSFSEYSDEMELKMKHGDREFYVYADRTKDSSDCWDNYQTEEIYSAVEKLLNESLPGGKVIEMRLGSSGADYYSLINTYFDGTNLDEVLDGCSGHIEMVLADTDLSDTDIADRFMKGKINLKFTSFDTVEHMEEFAGSDRGESDLYNYNWYQKYAPYITDYLEVSNGKVSRLDIQIQKTDEFEYAYFPVEWRSFSKTCNDIKAVPLDYDQLTESFGRENEEYCLSKPISRQYSFDSTYGDIWIYYPLEKLKDYDVEKIGLAWYSYGGMSNNRDISRAQICGDYAVFNIPFGEDYFMIVDNSGQEEYVPGWQKKEQ